MRSGELVCVAHQGEHRTGEHEGAAESLMRLKRPMLRAGSGVGGFNPTPCLAASSPRRAVGDGFT